MRYLQIAGRIIMIAIFGALGLMMLVVAADPGRGGDWPLSQLVLTFAVWIGMAVGAPSAIAALRRRAARRRHVAAEEADVAGRRRAQLIGGFAAAGAALLCWPLAPVVAGSTVLVLVCGWLLAALTGLLVYAQVKGLWGIGIGPIW